ncbi:hypothetical protein A3Q56_08472, partial [Intoshia linei]
AESFYSEMIEKKLYQFFYYNETTKNIGLSKIKELESSIENATTNKNKLKKELDFMKLRVYSFLIKCLSNSVKNALRLLSDSTVESTWKGPITSDDPKITVMFSRNEFKILRDKSVVTKAIKDTNNLYRTRLTVDCNQEESTSDIEIESTSSKLKTWHNKLGDLSFSGLKHLFKVRKLPDLTKKNFSTNIECLIYKRGKATKSMFKHKPSNEPKKSRVGEIVSSDTCGPLSVLDITWKLYFQVYLDYHSRLVKFQVFGCTAYTYIPLQSRSKLDVTAKRGIFVGLSPGELASDHDQLDITIKNEISTNLKPCVKPRKVK